MARIATRCVWSYSNGPVNTIAAWLFGSMPFSTCFSTTPVGGRTPTSFHVSLRRSGRQAAEIPLDQRLHRRQIEAADEDEREVARVGEAVLVERQRLVEVPLVDRRRRRHAPPRGGSGSERRSSASANANSGIARLVGQQRLHLRRPARANAAGSARGCVNREIDQLEHRLEILARAAAAQPFLELADVRTGRRRSCRSGPSADRWR